MPDWQTLRLDEVADRVATKNTAGYTRVMTVSAGRGLVDQEEYFTKRVASNDLSSYLALEPGDFVYNKSSSKDAPWGVVARNDSGAPAVVTSLYIAFRPRIDVVDPDFFLLACNSSTFFDSLRGRLREGARAHGLLNVRLLEFFAADVPIPPLAEQRRIVDLVASVDDQIASISLETVKARRILSALRADVPTADERLLSAVIEGIDSGRSALTAGTLPRPGHPRVLKLSAVQLGVFDADEAKELDDLDSYSSIHLVDEGDLLVTRSNTPDRVGYVAVARDVPAQTYLPDLIWRIRPDKGVITTDYLGHVLSAPEWRARIMNLATGTSASMQKINKKNFGTLKVPVPSLDEQADYVTRCDVAAAVVRSLRSETEALRSARNVLLAGLLAGAIEIPESYDRLLGEVA